MAEFVDDNESIYRRRTLPPAYRRMRALIDTGHVNAIYVWHPDRLYRSLRDLEDLVDMVDSFDLTICTVRAGSIDLSTPSGRLVARMLGTAARFEVEHKAERIARRNKEDAARGLPGMGGIRPIGYERDRVTINEVEAAAIQSAARAILDGEKLAAARQQFISQIGRSVDRITFKAVMISPRIAGYRLYRPIADLRRGIKTGVVTKAVWPGILDEETWIKVRLLLLDPRRSGAGGRQRHLLTGILRCGRCGGGLVGTGTLRYACRSGPRTCGSVAVAKIPVERTVIDWCLSQESKQKLRALARRISDVPIEGDVERDRRRKKLAIRYADGLITEDEWTVARRRLDFHDGRLLMRRRENQELADSARRALATLAGWETATSAARRAVLHFVLRDRIVHVEPAIRQTPGRQYDRRRVTFSDPNPSPRAYVAPQDLPRRSEATRVTPDQMRQAWTMLDQGHRKSDIAVSLGLTRGRLVYHLYRPRPSLLADVPAVSGEIVQQVWQAKLGRIDARAAAGELPFPPSMLSIRAAAMMLHINQATVVHLVKLGILKSIETSQGHVRFRVEDVEKLLSIEAELRGPDWTDAEHAAHIVGVNPRTIRRWASNGQLEKRRTLRGSHHYPVVALASLIKARHLYGADPNLEST